MNDLISRREVTAILDKYRVPDSVYHEINKLHEFSADREKGEWIPVSERLPEKNVWVLVTVEQNDNCYQEIMRRNNYIEAWTDNIDNYTDEITAWMPLPEPYKAERGEE